jgi:hypothetical protein
MLKTRFLGAAAGLVVLAASGPIWAQNGNTMPELPIKRAVLFSSGVGYFQRDGEINGQAAVSLQFHEDQINDVLKSLIVQDRGNGQVRLVQYDNRNPIERTLKSFALDLTGDPSLGKLLTQARGERVQVTLPQENAGNPIEGVIVGVERQKQPAGKDQVITIEQLNLLTDKGIISRPLSRVERIEFVKPALKEELRKALETLAAGRDRQKKTVALHFSGAGRRAVSVGYLVESPVWKTTYRLAVNDGKLTLQGWAIVENTSDEDWMNVRVGLVEGRPISFRMNLYEPLFVRRPLVELERFASLVPQRYEGELPRQQSPRDDMAIEEEPDEAPAKEKAKVGPGGGGRFKKDKKDAPGFVDITKSTGGAATAELGEFFQYEIKEPVSLARQKSALLPILNQAIQGKRVSIYNERVQAKHPMLGLSLKNTSGLHLMQGPVTVLEQNSYAGDALLPDLRPDEDRLISYAVDLGVEVVPSTDPKKPDTEDLVNIKIVQGILHATYKQRQTRTYTVANRNKEARDVIIEHPRQAGWKLVMAGKDSAPKETRDVYRFLVPVAPRKTSALEVVVEKKKLDQVVLTNSTDHALRFFISRSTQPGIKEKLSEAIALKSKWTDTQRAIERERDALATLDKNQARLRENLKILEKTSDLYKTSMKRFERQENEIEERQARVNQLQDQADRQRRDYEGFIAKLDVE